jgi:CSLREA domain-containing protein
MHDAQLRPSRTPARARALRTATATIGTGLALLAFAGSAQAASFVVNSTGDASDATLDGTCATAGPPVVCTLRAAIEESENAAGADTITFTLPSPSTIGLASALPTIQDDLTITGPGVSALTVTRTGAAPYRIFTTSGDVEISGMTISGGLDDGTLTGSGSGGGILNNDELALDGVTVTGNTASEAPAGTGNADAVGGGISNVTGGLLSITRSTISANNATASEIGTNDARAAGGGISSIAVAGISVSDSTISGNTASATEPTDPVAVGGGVSMSVGLGAFTNVTISGNRAITSGTSPTSQGGGIMSSLSALRITSSTVAFNEAITGANIMIRFAALGLRNTIVSNPVTGSNCATSTATIVSSGFNLASDASCNLTGTGDQPTTDPLLAPLANNGGPTLTHAPAIAGPAVDEGNSTSSGVHPTVATDQRGAARPADLPKANDPAGNGADIGAYEYGAYVGTVLAAAPKGYWRFGEGSGTVQKDSSGNGNNGTYLGGVTLGQPGALVGDPDTASLYDGVNDTSRVPDANSLDVVPGGFSIEGWIKRTGDAKSQELMNKGGRGFQLSVMNAANGNKVFFRKANITTIAQSTNGIPADGAYHHIVATVNGPGSTAKIYVDGVDVTQVLPAGNVQVIEDTTFPLTFGIAGGMAANFDEFAVYDQVLTPAEALAHYTAGVGGV